MTFKNFKASEFACPCKKCNNKAPEMDIALMFILQFIRNKYASPVTITSGMRCEDYNNTLEGAVKNSDHLKGKAADFQITGITNSLAKRKEIINLIRYMPNFKYAYCDKYILYADGTSKVYPAKWMGNSIHISVS